MNDIFKYIYIKNNQADPGEPSEEDAFEKAIIERNIFQIKPRSGTLGKG